MTNVINLSNQIKNREKTDWFTILPAEALTAADRTSGMFYHPDPDIGLMLKVIVANEAGSFSATVNILAVDPAGGSSIIYTSSAITANGTTLLYIKPGGGTNGLFTIVPFALPREFKVMLDYTGTPASDKDDTVVYGCFV
jgi:hypothetical protein